MIKKLLYVVGSVFIVNNIHADTTYVFCATKDRKWEWLKVDGKYVSVNGEWKHENIASVYFSYFKIRDEVKVEDLQRQCIQHLGASYIYAQPADNRFQDWAVFGIDEQNQSAGFHTHCYNVYLNITTCVINEHINKRISGISH
jgi:hypothetical protein